MSNASSQWTAEWWLNCPGCLQERVIDGRTAEQRYATLEGLAYKKIGNLWICPGCVKAFEAQELTISIAEWIEKYSPASRTS
jgi:hypothetical protein